MIRIRESFGAKLLSALLGTMGLLLLVLTLVVQVQTNRVVGEEVDRTISTAGTLFQELNDLQEQQAARLARPFTSGRRALALLDEAIRSGDVDFLAGEVDYEMQLAALDTVLLVFTDPRGKPVLSMVAGDRVLQGDPANVVPMAEALLDGSAMETRGYRVVDERIYNVRSLYIELVSRPIGTITFGLPIQQSDVARIGEVGGFEACLFAEGRCVVETAGVTEELGAALLEAAQSDESARISLAAGDYSVRSEPLRPGEPGDGRRIVAVPLDPVLQPFRSIQRALLLGGGAALILSGLLGLALSNSLTRPVRDLVHAANRVAAGHYGAEVHVNSSDEMRTLANAFNDMTHGLLVREQYRSVLDKVVSQDVAQELLKGKVELGGENRDVSVLFADIRGFTPMTEGMEPQRVIGLLNECMEHLSSAIDAERGVVDKFIGDEIMAVFGAPVTQEDHALRAVRAAIQMQEGVVAMNARRAARGEAPFRVGIGISSGIAVAGNMGSADRLNYTVLGETVNLAARLTDRAGPGEILVSEATRGHLSSEGLPCSPAGSFSLKGFSADVPVYRVECGVSTDTS